MIMKKQNDDKTVGLQRLVTFLFLIFWIFSSEKLASDENDGDKPDLLVLLGEAHLLVHVQVQHMLGEQVHLTVE